MRDPMLEILGLTGGYSRRRPVLRRIDAAVRPGELVALLGLNGAGKSTLLKHIVGLLSPHEGTVRVNGHTLASSREAYRASLVFVPESPVLYEELTVWEHLEWNAMAYGIERSVFLRRAEELLARFRMEREKEKFASHLSKGMRQKVMLMGAFLVRPCLYLIDEPFLGLDPLAIRTLTELMREEKETGRALLVSSHLLPMMEGLCDRYIILHEGTIAAGGSAEDVLRAAGLKPEDKVERAFFRLVGGDAP